MTEVARLRDSTQILLPTGSLAAIETDLEEEFMVSVRDEDGHVRIIGSPVVIKSVCDFLARNGIPVA
jgi:hypothetical protein